ncbi:MAG TPA: 30S ribosomal protein S3 [Chloroflexota bacterium]|nr:30S ribosomal protein S3 [Chloroflexota bacterium]
MGQKVHPIGFRLGIIKDWQARWYANRRDFPALVHEDLKVRRFIMEGFGHEPEGKRLFIALWNDQASQLRNRERREVEAARRELRDLVENGLAVAGVSQVTIERSANQMTVIIAAAKPGIVIGKSGAKVELVRKALELLTNKKVRVTIQEIRQPELDARLVARNIAEQLERRVAFRRAMKQAVQRAMRAGAKGIRVQVAGRLGGAEMSRTEWEREGRVPLHTLRADIDFGTAEAHTTYGVIGVKAWIYRGDVIPGQQAQEAARPAVAAPAPRGERRAPAARPEGRTRPAAPRTPSGRGARPVAPAEAPAPAPAPSAAPAPEPSTSE